MFLPFRMSCCSGLDLQTSSEDVLPNKNAMNALMNVKEEKTIIVATIAPNGEDIPILKKKGRPSKGRKNALQQRWRYHKKTIKKATKEVVNLVGSSSEEERFTQKWQVTRSKCSSRLGKYVGRIYKICQNNNNDNYIYIYMSFKKIMSFQTHLSIYFIFQKECCRFYKSYKWVSIRANMGL